MQPTPLKDKIREKYGTINRFCKTYSINRTMMDRWLNCSRMPHRKIIFRIEKATEGYITATDFAINWAINLKNERRI